MTVGAVACFAGAAAAFFVLLGSQEISPNRAAPAITHTAKREPIIRLPTPVFLQLDCEAQPTRESYYRCDSRVNATNDLAGMVLLALAFRHRLPVCYLPTRIVTESITVDPKLGM